MTGSATPRHLLVGLAGLGLFVGILVWSRRGSPEQPPPPIQTKRADPETVDPAPSKTTMLTHKDLQVYSPSGKPLGKPTTDGVEFIDPNKEESPNKPASPTGTIPATGSAAIQALLDLERSGNGPEREAMAAALAQLMSSNSGRLAEFIQVVQSAAEKDLSRIGIVLLGRVERPEAIQALLGIAQQGGTVENRLLAVRSLLQNGTPSGAPAYEGLPELRPLLSDTVSESRMLPLLDLLRQVDEPRLLQGLVENLSRFQDFKLTRVQTEYPQITKELVGRLKAEADPTKASALISGLQYTRSPEARDAIVEVLKYSADPRVLMTGLTAIVNQTDSAASLEAKLMLTQNPSDNVRQKAYEALSVGSETGRSPEFAQKIGQAITTDPAPAVRTAGARTLATCGDAGRAFLTKLTGDADPQVRQTAQYWLNLKRR